MFIPALSNLPESLRATVDLTQWSERLSALELPTDFSNSMVKVWAMSEFVSQHCDRRPKILLDLIQSGDFKQKNIVPVGNEL